MMKYRMERSYIKTPFWNLGVSKHQEVKGKIQANWENYIINGNAKKMIHLYLISLAKKREVGWTPHPN